MAVGVAKLVTDAAMSILAANHNEVVRRGKTEEQVPFEENPMGGQ